MLAIDIYIFRIIKTLYCCKLYINYIKCNKYYVSYPLGRKRQWMKLQYTWIMVFLIFCLHVINMRLDIENCFSILSVVLTDILLLPVKYILNGRKCVDKMKMILDCNTLTRLLEGDRHYIYCMNTDIQFYNG